MLVICGMTRGIALIFENIEFDCKMCFSQTHLEALKINSCIYMPCQQFIKLFLDQKYLHKLHKAILF